MGTSMLRATPGSSSSAGSSSGCASRQDWAVSSSSRLRPTRACRGRRSAGRTRGRWRSGSLSSSACQSPRLSGRSPGSDATSVTGSRSRLGGRRLLRDGIPGEGGRPCRRGRVHRRVGGTGGSRPSRGAALRRQSTARIAVDEGRIGQLGSVRTHTVRLNSHPEAAECSSRAQTRYAEPRERAAGGRLGSRRRPPCLCPSASGEQPGRHGEEWAVVDHWDEECAHPGVNGTPIGGG
jgi:hypothetical protein